VVGLLWTGFGTTVAFTYSAILFALGALLVLRTQSGATIPKRPSQN
jgi:hypothetical protein